jgi:hypothetical protein
VGDSFLNESVCRHRAEVLVTVGYMGAVCRQRAELWVTG